MLRQSLLNLSRNERVRDLVTRAPITPELVTRFVAGEDVHQVVDVSADLVSKGLLVVIDHLGEHSSTPACAQQVVDEYRRLLAVLAQAQLSDAVEVSVKLSALGLDLGSEGRDLAREHAHTICRSAAEVGSQVTIDMEEHTTIEATLAIVRDLRTEHPGTGLVLQSALRRSAEDCREFATEGCRVRLCKGAYSRVPGVSVGDHHQVDLAFVRCLRILMEGPGYPMVATHDPRLVAITEELASTSERSRDSFEFQMLHGIRPVEQRRLVDIGYRSRVYLPYGTQWYEYFIRRVAEKPATVGLIGRSLLSRR